MCRACVALAARSFDRRRGCERPRLTAPSAGGLFFGLAAVCVLQRLHAVCCRERTFCRRLLTPHSKGGRDRKRRGETRDHPSKPRLCRTLSPVIGSVLLPTSPPAWGAQQTLFFSRHVAAGPALFGHDEKNRNVFLFFVFILSRFVSRAPLVTPALEIAPARAPPGEPRRGSAP